MDRTTHWATTGTPTPAQLQVFTRTLSLGKEAQRPRSRTHMPALTQQPSSAPSSP